MKFTDADVAEIIRILDATPCNELEIETERFRLTLQRGAGGQWRQQRETLAAPTVLAAAAPAAAAATPGAPAAAPAEDGLLEVRAPIVGTFYRSPQPGAPPFVAVGDTVGPDTVVAIIEVMKLMNSVPAGVAGEVVAVLPADGELVRQGQCLLRVRPGAG